MEFPLNLHNALKAIADEYELELFRETHYDAIDRELSWFEGNNRKNINFTLVDGYVAATFCKDKFPFCPKFLIWCHNNIPMFPFSADIDWKRIEDLPVGEDELFYYHKIVVYIENARQN